MFHILSVPSSVPVQMSSPKLCSILEHVTLLPSLAFSFTVCHYSVHCIAHIDHITVVTTTTKQNMTRVVKERIQTSFLTADSTGPHVASINENVFLNNLTLDPIPLRKTLAHFTNL